MSAIERGIHEREKAEAIERSKLQLVQTEILNKGASVQIAQTKFYGTAQLQETQRLNDSVSQQIRQTKFYGAAQLKEAQKLNDSVSKFTVSIKEQQLLLKQSNAINVAALDTANRQLQESKRQTALMEYETQKRTSSDLTKEIIFQFNQHLKYINSLGSNIEKFVLSKMCIDNINDKGIRTEDLTDIQDKEYFANALENVNKIADEAEKNLMSDERDELDRIIDTSNALAAIDGFTSQADASNEKILNISKDRGILNFPNRWVMLAFVVISFMNKFTFIISLSSLLGAWIYKNKKNKLAIQQIQDEFDNATKDFCQKFNVQLNLNNYKGVLNQVRSELRENYSSIHNKYPSLDIL